MTRKPKQNEHIHLRGVNYATGQQQDRVHRSIKDVVNDRIKAAEKKGEVLSAKHSKESSLFEDGRESEYLGITDYYPME